MAPYGYIHLNYPTYGGRRWPIIICYKCIYPFGEIYKIVINNRGNQKHYWIENRLSSHTNIIPMIYINILLQQKHSGILLVNIGNTISLCSFNCNLLEKIWSVLYSYTAHILRSVHLFQDKRTNQHSSVAQACKSLFNFNIPFLLWSSSYHYCFRVDGCLMALQKSIKDY